MGGGSGIVAEGITRRFGNTTLLADISLRVSRGEVLTLCGPSGCGKTTLLRMIAGFDLPDAGIIWIDGVEVGNPERALYPFNRNVSMIFQNLALWPHMTVREHLEFAVSGLKHDGRSIGAGPDEQVDYWLETMHIQGLCSRYPHELSGGEKQRLALARAFICRPGYLLMDEPFSSLDPFLKEKMWKVVHRIRDDDTGILYVSHDVNEAFDFSDRVAFMIRGRIGITGYVADIKEKYGASILDMVYADRGISGLSHATDECGGDMVF